jgi:hypothetical protein
MDQKSNLSTAKQVYCPCGKGSGADLQRIHRTWLMKIFLFWLPLRRYHCFSCMRNRWLLYR